ncbi:Ig-like domain-containing protein, partial [Rhodococcus sp. NPDC055112]
MRSIRARRAAMIGTAALLLVAPCVALAQAEPAAPASALPADMVAAIQRDLGLNPAQYLEQADTGQELLRFADTLRGKFPTAFAGVWLDAAGAPLVGLADGPDKAAARTAVEAAGYQVKDQARSEQALSGLLGQLNTWVQQLPAPLAGLINGTAIDPAANDIALEVEDTAEGQGLQLPDFLSFVRIAHAPAPAPSSREPQRANPVASKVTLDPIKGAKVDKITTLTAKVNPAAAGGTVTFKDDEYDLDTVQVGADGTVTYEWTPRWDDQHTITATFSGRDGVAGSSTTAQVTVAPADSDPVASTITLEPITGAKVDKITTLTAKVNPAAAGGTVTFKDDEYDLD